MKTFEEWWEENRKDIYNEALSTCWGQLYKWLRKAFNDGKGCDLRCLNKGICKIPEDEAPCIEPKGHWCKGRIVDGARSGFQGKWLLKCSICGRLYEGDKSSSIGLFTPNKDLKK